LVDWVPQSIPRKARRAIVATSASLSVACG
jgi:hypothetical protein